MGNWSSKICTEELYKDRTSIIVTHNVTALFSGGTGGKLVKKVCRSIMFDVYVTLFNTFYAHISSKYISADQTAKLDDVRADRYLPRNLPSVITLWCVAELT